MRSAYSLILLFYSFFSYSQDTLQDILPKGPIGMTVDQFNRRVKTTGKPLMVYFTADWCTACKRQKPVLRQVFSETSDGAELLIIDMETNPLIADYFEIDALPALVLYKDGLMVWSRIGFQEKEKIMEQIKALMRKK